MNTRPRPILTVGLLLTMPLSAVAQLPDLPYSSGSTGADGPLDIPGTPHQRYNIGSAYDAERDQIVIFGGAYRNLSNLTSTSWFVGDTWLFDGVGWTRATPATSPGARIAPAMAYDPVRKEVVLFGGYSRNQLSPSYDLSDTWTWDGSTWTSETPTTSPPANGYSKMVWDAANERILLFGGATGPLKMLWAWDGSEWSEITTATEVFGSSSPSAQYTAMAYEASSGRTILYNESLRQTWVFDGTDWSQITTTASPDTGAGCDMTYDAARDEIVLFAGGGSSQTWVFKDDDWTRKFPATAVSGRSYHGVEYFASQSKVYAFCGDSGSWAFQNTDAWDGSDWTNLLSRYYTFDMTDRPDGVWNFTSINVPPYTDVYFTKNSTNTPVTWLATEDVTIAGRVILNGQTGFTGGTARGGPGGYDGGRGGIPGSLLGLYAGSPGAGPGGGAPGGTINQAGAPATHRGVYGNALVQPPTGGSGGGGGASNDSATVYGGNGGAGAGAIVIKSSRDIELIRGWTAYPPGSILANGGSGHRTNGSWGGAGSAGSIRLVGDRVSGDGTLQATGGGGGGVGGPGWIRVETFFQPFNLVSNPAASVVSPVGSIAFGDQPRLRVVSVAGEAVPQPPAALVETPDVIFANNATPVSIVVFGDNVPEGTEITLTIETPGGTLMLPDAGEPAVTLGADGSAVFNTILEDGHGTIRAFADYQVAP